MSITSHQMTIVKLWLNWVIWFVFDDHWKRTIAWILVRMKKIEFQLRIKHLFFVNKNHHSTRGYVRQILKGLSIINFIVNSGWRQFVVVTQAQVTPNILDSYLGSLYPKKWKKFTILYLSSIKTLQIRGRHRDITSRVYSQLIRMKSCDYFERVFGFVQL